MKLESYFYSSFVCLFTRERVKWNSNWDTVVGGKNVALEWVLLRWKEKNNAKQNGGCHPIEAWVIEDGFACIKCHWFYIIFSSIIFLPNIWKKNKIISILSVHAYFGMQIIKYSNISQVSYPFYFNRRLLIH